jgi:hypothetical protein
MKPYPEFCGTRQRNSLAAYFFLLILGTVTLFNLLDNPILPSDILIGLIAFSFLVAIMGIKNTNNG